MPIARETASILDPRTSHLCMPLKTFNKVTDFVKGCRSVASVLAGFGDLATGLPGLPLSVSPRSDRICVFLENEMELDQARSDLDRMIDLAHNQQPHNSEISSLSFDLESPLSALATIDTATGSPSVLRY